MGLYLVRTGCTPNARAENPTRMGLEFTAGASHSQKYQKGQPKLTLPQTRGRALWG